MKNILISVFTLLLTFNAIHAQNDSMYIVKAGSIIGKYNVSEVDSIIFYKHITVTPSDISYVQITGGMFIMGSAASEVGRNTNETQHAVTISNFKMSKYEITNTQFADFLNAKNINNFGLYSASAKPLEPLIYESNGISDWGLHYANNKWTPVIGFEKHPVIFVTWNGAFEYAKYVGGRLPTEAEWEYACRANTTTPFSTGNCLSNLQDNYNWDYPYSTCANSNLTLNNATTEVGLYQANAFGLYDMHGNVCEMCSDWYGDYPTTPQVNPKGPFSGSFYVFRGGSFQTTAGTCRSAARPLMYPSGYGNSLGFRVVSDK